MTSLQAFDTVITNGATTYGFMVAKGKKGKARTYRDGQVIPSRQLADAEFTEAQYPPSVQLPLPQEDWRAGMGRTHRRLDIKAFGGSTIGYQNGLKVDASGDSKVKLARKLTDTSPSATMTATSTKFGGGIVMGYGAAYINNLWWFRDDDTAGAQARTRAYLWDWTNLNWVSTANADATAQKVVPGGLLYGQTLCIPMWGLTNKTDARAYAFSALASTWTQSTLAVNDFYFFAKDTGGTMFAGYRPGVNLHHHVYTSTDPSNTGAWTGPYAIGDAAREITALVGGYGTLVLVCKEDGLYTINSAGTVVSLDKGFFKPVTHVDNFRNACLLSNGSVLLPLGEGGMWEVDDAGNLRDVSFRLTMPEQTYLHGNVINLAAVPDGVFALVQDATTSTTMYILYGEWLTINGVTDYRWHVLGSTTKSSAAIDKYRQFCTPFGHQEGTAVYRRLWISRSGTSDSNTSGPEFLPRLNDRDDLYTTDSNAIFDTVIEDAYLPNENKNYVSVICTTNNLSSGAGGHTIPVDYSEDDTAFASLGTLNSDSQTLTFTAITGKKLVLRFKPLLGTPDGTSPELLDFRIVVQVRPPAAKVLYETYMVGDGIRNKAGAMETKSKVKRSFLTTLNTQAGEVTIKHAYKPAGDSYLSLPSTMQEQILTEQRGQRPNYLISMMFLEL